MGIHETAGSQECEGLAASCVVVVRAKMAEKSEMLRDGDTDEMSGNSEMLRDGEPDEMSENSEMLRDGNP